MWDAGHEARRTFRKEPRRRFRYDIAEFVFGDSIPDIEKEMAAPLENAARLAVTLDLIGKEHRAELAGDHVKPLILERQSERVALAPRDAALRGRLQHILRFNAAHLRGELARIRFENEGNQEPVVDFGDRSGE